MNEKPKTISYLLCVVTDGNNTSVYGSELIISESQDILQYVYNKSLYSCNYNRNYKEAQ